MGDEDPWAALDAYLPPQLRAELEAALWAPIEAQATLEVLQQDPSFFADPGRHPAMFADHGVVHVRDVAAGLVRLVEVVDGVLLPARPAARRSLVESWGVALTYLHDVGMVDLSRDGRRVHPQYAAHSRVLERRHRTRRAPPGSRPDPQQPGGGGRRRPLRGAARHRGA